MRKFIFLLALVSAPVFGQSDLSLQQAVRVAMDSNPEIEASIAGEKAAEARIREARSGYLPQVSYTEQWQRSNNPVFVFGSLLTQRQFTQNNFALDSLNRPGFLNNFQSQVVLEQNIFDSGRTKNQLKSSRLAGEIAQEGTRRTRMQTILRVVQAYYGAQLAEEALRAARESLKSAEADLQRAQNVREAGMSTDADVLSIKVYLATVKEQAIQREYDLEIARAALNDVLGVSQEARYTLTTKLIRVDEDLPSLQALQDQAIEARPELKQAEKATQMAVAQQKSARAGYLPQFFFRSAFEADRQEFANKGGANWYVGAGMRWNLFDGMGNYARVEEAKSRVLQSEANRRRADSGAAARSNDLSRRSPMKAKAMSEASA
jgi:outer membrane protein TolC